MTVAPAFTAFFERITEIVIANRDAIVEFGQILGSLLKPLLEGVAVLLNGLVVAFATLFATVAQGINAAFGTNLSTAQVFAGALGLIVLQLARVPVAIALIVTALGKLIQAIDKSDLSPLAKTALKAAVVIATAFAVLPTTISSSSPASRWRSPAFLAAFPPWCFPGCASWRFSRRFSVASPPWWYGRVSL